MLMMVTQDNISGTPIVSSLLATRYDWFLYVETIVVAAAL